MITTQKDLRAAFWEAHPQYKRGVKPVLSRVGITYYVEKRQNEYPADVRVAWVDFIDCMCRDGQISEALAQRATL